MRVRIDSDGTTIDPRDGQPAAQLTARFGDWLAQDRAIAPHVEIRRIRPETTDGAMSGELVEWISLAISSGFSSTALVYSHKTFRASLPTGLRSEVRMVVEHGGVRVVVENGTEQDIARVARALAAASEPAQPPAGDTPPQSTGNGDS